MPSADYATNISDSVFYEYRFNGILQRCFKERDEALTYCEQKYNMYPQDHHQIHKAVLHRTCIACMVP